MVIKMKRRKGLSFIEKKKKISTSLLRDIFGTIFGVCAAVLIAFVLIYSVGIQTSMIGVSMEPELYNGQKVLINRLSYTIFSPKRGDVVIFLPNGNENAHYYAKRVVGLPGETVKITGGVLTINGEEVEENEAYDKMEDPGIAENELTLGPEEYFVLGDNRNNSEDSRSANIGPVSKNTIIGKAWFKLPEGTGKIGLIR